MNFEYNYKDGELVSFDNGVIHGVGFIVGAASAPMAVIGTTYIVKVENSNIPLPNDGYPFSTITMQENFLIHGRPSE